MREIDRIAIEETGPNLFQMMENAGRNLALHVIDMLGSNWQSKRIIILAGAGGNGGGGICAARHLANRGAQTMLCLADPGRLSPVPKWQLNVYENARGETIAAKDLIEDESTATGIVVDSLIGYSLKGAPRGTTAHLIRWALEGGAPVLSLDVPSGIDAATGTAPGVAIKARRTLTLALPKTGLTAPHTGELWLADIGIPRTVFDRLDLDYKCPFGGDFSVPLAIEHRADG